MRPRKPGKRTAKGSAPYFPTIFASLRDNRIAWDRTMDLHSDFWQGRGDCYYALRQALVDGLLAATDYAFTSPAEGQYEIVKKSA